MSGKFAARCSRGEYLGRLLLVLHTKQNLVISMPAPQLPIDVLIYIIELIDDPRDLLSLALTNHALRSLVVPRHLNYRRISCAVSLDHVWKHLLDAPGACFRIRYLDIKLGSRTVFPKMCKIDYQETSHVHARFYDFFLQSLSKMVNLKVFKYDTRGLNDKTTRAISEAIEKAGCELEEIEVRAQWGKTRSNDLIDVSPRFSRIHQFSLFHDHLPSLQKYTIQGYNNLNNSAFTKMLSNAPNLTHMNISFLSMSELLSGHWPNLQHLVSRCSSGANIETCNLRGFFLRHQKLVTLSTGGILLSGWATESDDFLPNLRSLGITTRDTITSNIAVRLTHMYMTPQVHWYLKRHGTVLYSLESCVYLNPDSGNSMRALVPLIPNVQKLCVCYTEARLHSLPTNNGNQTIIELARIFARYAYLRVLIGPLDDIEISDGDHPLFKILYDFPSLLYIRTRLKKSGLRELLRLERDNIAKTMRYVPENGCPPECDVDTWGGFYGPFNSCCA